MKSLKIISAMALSAILFTGCEKEEAVNPVESNSTNNGVKNSFSQSKSGDPVDSLLSQYITKLYYDSTLNQSIEAETSIFYEEAYLNWKYSHVDRDLTVSKTFDLEFNLNLSDNGGIWMANPNEIETLNDQIETDLVQIANDSSLEGVQSGSKFWSNIFIEKPSVFSSNITIKVKATLGGVKSWSGCGFNNDWKGFHKDQCPSLPTNTQVTSIITNRLNNGTCVNNFRSFCPAPTPLVGNKIAYYIKYRYAFVKTIGWNVSPQYIVSTFMWRDFVPFACISSIDAYNEVIALPPFADKNRPVINGVTYNINNYRVGPTHISGVYGHGAAISYFRKCKRVEIELFAGENEHTREPMF